MSDIVLKILVYGFMLLVGVFSFVYYSYKMKMEDIKYVVKKMKKSLLELLREDGYDCKVEDDMVVVNYRQMRFKILFSGSFFGCPYVRVMVINAYTIEGMEVLHPFVMDAIMGRATYRNIQTGNISFEDYCSCYYCTDVKSIKDFYRGLKSILLMLIEHEEGVCKDFTQIQHDFAGRYDNQEGKHIGFKTANANQDRETTHSVAAEMDVTK